MPIHGLVSKREREKERERKSEREKEKERAVKGQEALYIAYEADTDDCKKIGVDESVNAPNDDGLMNVE